MLRVQVYCFGFRFEGLCSEWLSAPKNPSVWVLGLSGLRDEVGCVWFRMR